MTTNDRPTLEQVAALAGVGRGTVSRVINGSPKVSEQARAAVERAVAELGYVPNRAARSLASRRTDAVALVVSESGERFFAEPFFGRMVGAISAALADTELQIILAIAQTAGERARLERFLTRQHVDGALLISLHGDDPLPAHLEEREVVTVCAGRPSGAPVRYWVDADNRGGAADAVRHLVARGRRRIATIAGPQDMAVGIARLQGYHDIVGTAATVAHGDFSEASGAAAMRELLDGDSLPDAVFAASDTMALGAMRVLREHGLSVPGDVAVVGFDDSALAGHTDPPLTSVHQPFEAMGRAMVDMLLTRIEEQPVATPGITCDTHLVVRDST